MERAGGYRTALSRLSGLGMVMLVLLVGVFLAWPGTALALHYFEEGNSCLSCHTVLLTEGEPNTSHILASSRTLPLMKAYNGGAPPVIFGCTYCHSHDGNTEMKEALSHFGPKASKHPVGRNVITLAETNNEYLSGVSSTTTNDLDCVDCHDPALLDAQALPSHVGHADKLTAPRSSYNPYMLRNVTVLGEYDNLCRSCHGSSAPTVKGKDVRVTSHGDAVATLTEKDLTPLFATAAGGQKQCNTCHDTHYSAKVKLFNDGKETGESTKAIVSTDCTTICHYAGDVNNGYENHGHGKTSSTYPYKAGKIDFTNGFNTTMDMGCTSCHIPIDTSDTSTARKKHAEVPTGGTIWDNYKGKFDLNLPIQTWDTGTAFGNPIIGVCYSCHSSYEPHMTSAGGAGCLECHDEHAEGSGVGSNAFMIPQTSKKNGTFKAVTKTKAGTEAVNYILTRYDATGNVRSATDFYRTTDVTGVCDNAECHTIAGRVPLSTFMISGNHSGGNQTPGTDCESCHKHSGDSSGGWRATDSCSNSVAGCHGTTDVEAAPNGTVFPDRAGKHAEHVARIAAVNSLSTSGTATCNWCHPGGAHGGDTLVPAEMMNGTATHFKTINGGTDSGETVTQSAGNVTCAGVNCHYNKATVAADWYGAPTPGCTYCHVDTATYTATALPNAHDRHVLPTASSGYAYSCTLCHPSGAYAADHQSGTVSVAFSTALWGNTGNEATTGGNGLVKYGTGTSANYYSCSGISCHGDYVGGNTANAPNWQRTDAVLGATNGDGNCGSCHGTDATKTPMPAYTDGTPKANKHPLHVTTNGYTCQLCHFAVTSNGTGVTSPANHANSTVWNVAANTGAATLYQFTWATPNCTATACHGGNSVAWANTQIACNTCHSYVGGAVTNTDVNDFAWAGGTPTMSKISYSEYTVASGGHGQGAPRAINKSCNSASCHDSAVGHDTSANLTGANPFRLVDQDGGTAGVQFSCSYTTGCHAAGISGPQTNLLISTFTTHSKAAMSAAGYTAKRTWPAWDPQCTNCHDPHGDGNLSMMSRLMYDKAAFNVPAGPPPALPTEQTNLIFTDSSTGANTAGTSFADLDTTFSSLCQECHEDASVQSFHDNNTTGTASMSNHPATGTNPGDCTGCHKHTEGFKPSGDCSGCHASMGITAHLKLVPGGPDQTCDACHPGKAPYPLAHSANASANVVLIPNYTVVGINYTGNGETGIYLGGTATSSWGLTTEAEICWRCHDAGNDGVLSGTDPSEWGTNNRLAGLTPVNNYNYGTLNTRRWIGASWTSAQTASPSFAYKTALVQSTHAANPTGAPWNGPTGPGVDTAAQIRCSYCHDVHNRNLANLDTVSGKPYLRGNWVSNPYKEDGAPQSAQLFTNYSSWGTVPRASTNTAQLLGGYWIDRNMGSPNTWTYNQFGGLCALCHGPTKGSAAWTSAGIDAINQFGATYTEWVSGLNGHRNSVKGGTGIIAGESAARNIFNARGGVVNGNTSHRPLQHYQGTATPGDVTPASGFRGLTGDGALGYKPAYPVSRPCKYNTDEWGVDEYGTQAQTNYHLFTCSKCHNPHAGRLPRLMITNCLDTKHNTWDNLASYTVITQTDSPVNRGRSRSNMSSAQNCHRLRGDDTSDTRDSIGYSGRGWNSVTPW